MKTSESGLYRNSVGFMISALLHSAVIYYVFFYNPFKMKMGEEQELVSINLDVFAPIQAPNFAEELIASAAAAQLISQTEQLQSVEQEEITEEAEEEIKEEIKEEKPLPQIQKPKIVEKVQNKPKKRTQKEHKKPQEKARNLAATAQKQAPQNAIGSGMGKANADAAPSIGEFNMQKSKGDPNFRKIMAAIQKHKFYPQAAERMHKKGKVMVFFVVHQNGSISGLRVVKGCGHDVLDKGAIETVKRAAKEFPKLNKDYHVTVPIGYDIKA